MLTNPETMKKLLIILSIGLASCEPRMKTINLHVEYISGESENVSVSYNELVNNEGIFFHDGCIYTLREKARYSTEYRRAVRCGVKKFHVIK